MRIQSWPPNCKGLTLLELIVVIALIALLTALLVPAIQKVRENSMRTESANNMRQIILAAHNYSIANRQRMPALRNMVAGKPDTKNSKVGVSIFTALLPYVGEPDVFKGKPRPPIIVNVYLNPADPTRDDKNRAPASYAWNAQVFKDAPNLVATFQDGTSNTIALAEHYQNCGQTKFIFSSPFFISQLSRRAAFADESDTVDGSFPKLIDNQPVTTGNPPTTTGSLPGTFQAGPAIKDCDMRYPQSPFRSGMNIAMVDGAVRFISPSIAPSVFWAAVTPAGGDVIHAEW